MHELDKPECFDKVPSKEKAQVMQWISKNIEPLQTYSRKHTSYGLKHWLQYDIGIYLTNGAFKGAMLESGYRPQKEDEQNWIFRAKPSKLMMSRVKSR